MDAFDTETVNRTGGGHACLLVTSTRYMCFPKHFGDVFKFLARERMNRYVAWNMDFDVQAIVHENLIHWKVPLELGQHKQVRWRGYLLEYIPAKRFRASRNGKTVEIYDLWQFYQCSLRKAAEQHLGSDRKHDIPKHWYSRMDTILRAGGKAARRVIDYALQDAAVTLKLYDGMRDKLARLNLSMDRPISSGSIAMTRWQNAYHTPPKWVNTLFANSYYGGRVECHTLGNISTPTHLYDLKSAYPAVIRELPDIQGLVWGYGTQYQPREDEIYGAYLVQVQLPDLRFGPFAKRSRDGTIYYPVGNVETWVGLDGLKLIRQQGWVFSVKKYYRYCGQPNNFPFRDIDDLFAARKDPQLKLAAKLVMNSVYGKLAERQKETHKIKWGQFACVPMAAAVTERTRLKLWSTMMQCQGRVHFCATDSILADCEISCPDSPGLGDWEKKGSPTRVAILGTGRYVLWLADKIEIHLRGFDCDERSLKKLIATRRSYATLKTLRATGMKIWGKGMALMGDMNVLKLENREFRIHDVKLKWPDGIDRLPISCYFNDKWHGLPWINCDF